MTRQPAVNDPFAALAPAYEHWFDTALGAYIDQAEMAALDELLPAPGNGSVIEVGAGTGHVSRHLAGRGFRMIAVEPSVAMRAAGQPRSAGLPIEWSAAVAEALPFEDDVADGVLFFATLEFVRDPDAALREALRITRPGGWLAVGLLHALSPWAALYRHLADQGEAPWSTARFFTPEDLARRVGHPPIATTGAVHLAPQAVPPYEDAERAGQRAGNAPALQVLLFTTSSTHRSRSGAAQ